MAMIPRDALHKILAYDGRIQYKNGIYRNIIAPNDIRYATLTEKLKPLYKIPMGTHNGQHSIMSRMNFKNTIWDFYIMMDFQTEINRKYNEHQQWKYFQIMNSNRILFDAYLQNIDDVYFVLCTTNIVMIISYNVAHLQYIYNLYMNWVFLHAVENEDEEDW